MIYSRSLQYDIRYGEFEQIEKVEPVWYFQLSQNITYLALGLGMFVINTLNKLGRVIMWLQIINEYSPYVFGDLCKQKFPFRGSMAFNWFYRLACWMQFIC